jgi:hypothetical protein
MAEDFAVTSRKLLARDAGLTDHSQHFPHPQERHTDPTSLVDDFFNPIVATNSVERLACHCRHQLDTSEALGASGIFAQR